MSRGMHPSVSIRLGVRWGVRLPALTPRQTRPIPPGPTSDRVPPGGPTGLGLGVASDDFNRNPIWASATVRDEGHPKVAPFRFSAQPGSEPPPPTPMRQTHDADAEEE